MLAYQYDIHGMYIGSVEADESPLEPGVYLIPARSTLIAPPEHNESQTPVWNGADWSLLDNPSAPVVTSTPLDRLVAFLEAHPDVLEFLNNTVQAQKTPDVTNT